MNALIITASKQAQVAIAEVVGYYTGYEASFAESVESAAKKLDGDTQYDLLVINDSVPAGKAIAVEAAKKSAVIYFENADAFDKTAVELAESGIVVVPKPLSKITLLSAVRTVYAASMRIAGLKEENRALTLKLEEVGIIDRAKIALIERLGYTESEAHKYIEKQAMNLRVSKREIAMNVLRTYEY